VEERVSKPAGLALGRSIKAQTFSPSYRWLMVTSRRSVFFHPASHVPGENIAPENLLFHPSLSPACPLLPPSSDEPVASQSDTGVSSLELGGNGMKKGVD
jgi:hypothetical protein